MPSTTLPEPSFVDRDPVQILKECIEQYETDAGKPLQPAQVERLIIDLIVYRETLLRNAIQDAAKQNLWRYARFPMIDLLAEIVGAARLDAKPADTVLQVTLDAVSVTDTLYVAGTQVRTKDGKAIFALDADLTIPAGDTVSDPATATCTEAGTIGNGYAPGQITDFVVAPPKPSTVTNTVESENGAAQEDTERLRARLPDALAAFEVAGPEDAYRSLAKAAHPDVLDAYVETTTPGTVKVTVLATYGVPTGGLVATVNAALTPETARPINDTVIVAATTGVDYAITAHLTLYKGNESSAAQAAIVAAATAAAQAFVAEKAAGLGRAPETSQLYAKLKVGGVYAVAVAAPIGVVVAPDHWAHNTAIAIDVAGFSTEEEP
jgi:phage-related baseplate assembly protein